MAYNALEDKYAFGYFQNRSVQRHLKKLLKVLHGEIARTPNNYHPIEIIEK